MSLTYGTSAIRQKDYRIYLATIDEAFTEVEAFKEIVGNPEYDSDVTDLLEAFSELGECRADSIVLTGADGEAVEGNVVGSIILNKTCDFSAELLNATIANTLHLESMDGVKSYIVLIEKDRNSDDEKMLILIEDVVISFSENYTGGDIRRCMINVQKTPKSIGSFRKIYTTTAWST